MWSRRSLPLQITYRPNPAAHRATLGYLTSEIELTLRELRPGTLVKLKTTDGHFVVGVYESHDEGGVKLSGVAGEADEKAQLVAVDDVDRVLIPISLEEGPE